MAPEVFYWPDVSQPTQQRIADASLLSTIIIEHYHLMTSCDWFPVPVRSDVKSNLTVWCLVLCTTQNLSITVL